MLCVGPSWALLFGASRDENHFLILAFSHFILCLFYYYFFVFIFSFVGIFVVRSVGRSAAWEDCRIFFRTDWNLGNVLPKSGKNFRLKFRLLLFFFLIMFFLLLLLLWLFQISHTYTCIFVCVCVSLNKCLVFLKWNFKIT